MCILSEKSGLCSLTADIKHALGTALQISTYVFMLFGDVNSVSYTSALYKDANNSVYAFDPHCRDGKGFPSAGGSSVLLKFYSEYAIFDYANQLAKLLKATYYEIVAVHIDNATVSQHRKILFDMSQKKAEAATV